MSNLYNLYWPDFLCPRPNTEIWGGIDNVLLHHNFDIRLDYYDKYILERDSVFLDLIISGSYYMKE